MNTTDKDNVKTGQDAESVQSEAELIGRIIQSEQKLSEYFTTIITKSVTDQIERRNMARLRLFGIVSVILVSVIIPAVALWIRATIETQSDKAIEARFIGETQRLERDFRSFLDRERNYSSFSSYVLYLSERTRIPKDELKSALIRLKEIAGEYDLADRPDFPFLLDLIVRLVIQNGDLVMLSKLEARFGDMLASTPRTIPRLVRFYGQNLVGDHFTSSSRKEVTREKFTRYLGDAEDAPEFERLLALQLIVEDHLDGADANQVIGAIMRRAMDMDPARKASFISEMIRYTNPQYWEAPPTARNRRIAISTGNLIVEQRQFFLSMLDDRAVQSELITLALEQSDLENLEFAGALSSFRNAFLSVTSAGQDPAFQKGVRELVNTEIRPWIENQEIIRAIANQNQKSGGMTPEQIVKLENEWRKEFVSGNYQLIQEVLDRHVSRYLRRVKQRGVGLYREIQLMDSVGLLVGASDPNDVYWLGEYDKWRQAYEGGKDSLYIGSFDFDESVLAWVIEIGLPVVDPDTGKIIGTAAIDLDPSALDETFP